MCHRRSSPSTVETNRVHSLSVALYSSAQSSLHARQP